jgi:PAS domain S-box-containing protein
LNEGGVVVARKQKGKTEPEETTWKKGQAKGRARKIALIYFLIGGIWILVTDLFAEHLFPEQIGLFQASLVKGLFFVTATSVIVFHLIYTAFRNVSKAEAGRSESERSKGVLVENLPGIAYRCSFDREWTMQFISEGCYELTGYKPESLIGNKVKSYNDLIVPEYREAIWKRWIDVLKKGEKFKAEYEIITASGEVKWVFEQGQGVYDEDGGVAALEGLIIDITEQKEQEMKLRFVNEHDRLTGLYNRGYFEDLLKQDEQRKMELKRAVVLLSLNKINSISLTFGYRFAETLVGEVAASLSSLAGEERGLYRISFERFAFYFRAYRNMDELSGFCGEIVSALRKIKSLQFIASGIGILEIEPDCCEPDYILRNASIAAERAAGNTPFGCLTFDENLKAQVLRETAVQNELMRVLPEERGVIFLQYQPILDLKTNKIHGFEALARLNSKALGIVPPLEFIPMAEELQLIGPIGLAILREAGAFARQLESFGYGDMVMSVNISPLQLVMEDFIDDLLRIMEETELPARNLLLEITESFFSDNFEIINDKLRKIKGLGIRIAIDDFGSGYSSLARERELNVNCLKIDKFFIDKLTADDPDKTLTGDIISMAHKLGHCVVAEGVEDEAQKKYLSSAAATDAGISVQQTA